MSNFLLVLILSFIFPFALGVLVFYLLKEVKKLSEPKDNKEGELAVSILRQDLQEIKNEVKESREKNIATLQNQLQESRKAAQASGQIIKDVTEKLTELSQTNKQVMGFAQQLQSLENILKNPKQRGVLGEYALEALLERAFSPKQYVKQYQFKNGEAVDFALFIGEKILPIDAKFSLENYNRIVQEKDQSQKAQLEKIFKQDLKTRIDETAKYIRPEEGTFNFALMFIPAEGIYYDLLVNEVGVVNTRDLVEYAAKKKVSIVSPNSFYAILQTILEGLRAFAVEKSALQIRDNVEVLGKHISAYESYMKKLGSHLGTVCNTYNIAYKELGKIDKDVVKITGKEKQVDVLQIDKPEILD